MNREEYADALKKFLRQKNLKQQDIADKFGVNHATVNNLINGHTRFGKTKAIRWGEALGIDPLWLMTQGEQGVNPNDGDAPTTEIPKSLIEHIWQVLACVKREVM